MLGELIGECEGAVTGVRVISVGNETKLEVSLRGQGTLRGQPFSDFGTLVQALSPGGILRGDAHHVMLTSGGDIGDWSGFGLGEATGAGFKSTWGAYGHFDSPQGALLPLQRVVTAIEFDVQEDGAYRWRMWEWTGAAVPQAVG